MNHRTKQRMMNRGRMLFVTCICMLFIIIAPNVAAQGLVDDIVPARTIFLEAVDGNKSAVRTALEAFRSLEGRYPHHPLLQAYIGSTLSLRGRDIAARPVNRMREADEGLEVIDHALSQLKKRLEIGIEAELETKLVAAATFIALPELFHRGREGQRLIAEVIAHPQLAHTPTPLRAFAYMSAATAAQKERRTDDYQRFLTLVIQTDPQGRDGRKAQQQLKDSTTPK